jgi:opacity protein-like surface antigen
MKRVSVAGLVFVAGIGAARAADPPVLIPRAVVPAPSWTWTGLYIGTHSGAGFGITKIQTPAGTSIYGDTVRSPMYLGGVQAGYNWQVPGTGFVFGMEADASALASDGTNTCLASSASILSANCRVGQTFAGSVTGRAGYAVGPDARTLLFVKSGVAALRQEIEITTNGPFPPITTSTTSTRVGWTAGAGVERALTPAWSLKLEYAYMDFGTDKVATPATYLQAVPGVNAYFVVPGSTADARHSLHAVKLGVNLRLGEDSRATWRPSETEYRLRGATQEPAFGAEVEVGVRAWYSFGRHQKDLGGTDFDRNMLVSRLTYHSSAYSGEAFARIDTVDGVFLKGFAGAGKSASSGKMHDEDWLIDDATIPYSNTLSSPIKGSLGYATIDLGYAMFRGPSSKLGAFIGYNYFNDSYDAYGCAQTAAGSPVCSPTIPNATLVITQDNTWHSVRLGVNGVVTVAEGLTLTADAAYLPSVTFRGVDNHVLRTDVADTVSKESGNGQGVQFEALLAYSFSPSFSVGAGGRYWAMWTDNDALTNIFGTPCPCQTLPSRTERYGAFVQASYKFGGLQ